MQTCMGCGRTHKRGTRAAVIGSWGVQVVYTGSRHLYRCPSHALTCRSQNPALRHELSFEMGQVHSDMALNFGDNQAVLSREEQKCPLKTKSAFFSRPAAPPQG